MTKEEIITRIKHNSMYKDDRETADYIIKALEQQPSDDCVSREELLKAMDTWDKFGNDPNKGLIPLRTPALQDRYVPYVKYEDMVNCVKNMPTCKKAFRSVTENFYCADFEKRGK